MANIGPPPSITLSGQMTDSEWRGLDFHKYQMCEVIGSKDTSFWPITQEEDMNTYTAGFFVSGCTGAGPLYNIYLVDNRASPPSGVDLVEINDSLLIKDDTGNDIDTDDISWYRFDVTDILESHGAKSGQFTVKYIKDTQNFGDQSPCDMYMNYGTYGGYGAAGSGYVAAVLRSVDTGFLIGGL